MSFRNAEIKYRLQLHNAEMDVNDAKNKTKQEEMELATESSTLTQLATFQPNRSTMIVSSVDTDVLQPRRRSSKLSNVLGATQSNSNTATSFKMYNVISKNLQAILSSINEWMNNRPTNSNSYKIEIRQGHLIIMSLVKISEFEGVPRFMQAFPILPHVDSNGIEARYTNGELQIFAPFSEDAEQGENRKIEIDF